MVRQANPASPALDDEVGPTARRGILHLLAHAQELGALEFDLFSLDKTKVQGRQPDGVKETPQGYG